MLIRPATRADLVKFYDHIPRLKGWVAEHEGEIVAIAGYEYTPQALVVFSDLKEGFTGNIRIARAAKKIVDDARSTGRTVIAFLDEDIGSERFFEWLGFTQDDGFWRLDGDIGFNSDAVGQCRVNGGIDGIGDSHGSTEQGIGGSYQTICGGSGEP